MMTTSAELLALADELTIGGLSSSWKTDNAISAAMQVKSGPLYSLSLDAAVQLVPREIRDDGLSIALTFTAAGDHTAALGWSNGRVVGGHRSIALALVIACLRAKAAVMGDVTP